MRIDIKTHGVHLTDDLRMYIEQRLRFCLTLAGEQVLRVIVELTDTAESSNCGGNIRCCLSIALAEASDVFVEDTEADLNFAINRASDRARRTVKRKLNQIGRPSGFSDFHQLRMN